jgi:non-homologous end joining protein Ku
MLPNRTELMKLIKEAMPPEMKLTLSRTPGAMDKVLNDRATQAQDSYQSGLAGMLEAKGETHQEMVSNATQARNLAAREALRQAVEFETPPEEPTSESRAAA